MKKDRQEREKEILDEFRCTGELNKFVQEYGNLVYSVVQKTLNRYRIVHTKEDIEDLRNDVFIQFLVKENDKIKRYEQEKGSLSGWVKLITQNFTLNEIKKRGWLDLARRNFKFQIEDLEEITDDDDKKVKVKRELTQKVMENYFDKKKKEEEKELIQKAMEKMKPKDKEILNKYYFQLMDLDEIARALGEKYGTVAKKIHDAKKKLKRLIEEIIEKSLV